MVSKNNDKIISGFLCNHEGLGIGILTYKELFSYVLFNFLLQISFMCYVLFIII